MRSFESSRTALARFLPGLLLGSLGAGCNARLDISDETPSLDAGTGGTGGIIDPGVSPDAGTPTSSCEDGIRGGEETDIDCGGQVCVACVPGASCERHTDCTSSVCLAGVCAAPSCEDGIRDGNETGVDCGGDCARCRTSTCNCASSPELMPLDCDESEGYLSRCGTHFLSADGETFVFAMCHVDSSMSSTTSYTLYRRRADGTTETLGDAGPIGLSADGQRLLVTLADSESVALVGADGARTSVPLRYTARMSGDGATIFDTVRTTLGAQALVRWTEGGGVETLGELPLPATAGGWELGGVNHDGTAVAGHGFDGTRSVPFRWTLAGGIEDLGALPTGADGARPTTISADGSAIAGFTFAGAAEIDVFRWTATDQLQVMGPAVPLTFRPDAGTLLLSSDGATLVGAALLSGVPSLVRWGAGGTAVARAELAFVMDMTPDGSVLTGSASDSGFLWRPPVVELTTPSSAYDVTRVEALLEQSGADATGWTLESITNISDDGRIAYGGGTCGGVPTWYRMQLSP
jgi:hypothetical protein